MFDHRFSLESPTGALLNVWNTDAKGPERGVLLILHGLAEHAARYARFAGEAAAAGFHVYAADHRGHGSTTAADAPLRRFAKHKGAAKVVADALAVCRHAKAAHPGLPVAMLGHSMGGHLALAFAMRHGGELQALAVWNAAVAAGVQERLGLAALKVERALKGSDVASALFARATFERWAKAVPERRTEADWLSHDPAAVAAYVADPLCGWTPTVSLALDLVGLVTGLGTEEALSRLPSDLPVHLLGGSEDPATENGAAVSDLAGRIAHAGSRRVACTVVQGARHETLNEVEPMRGQAVAALLGWLDGVLPGHHVYAGS